MPVREYTALMWRSEGNLGKGSQAGLFGGFVLDRVSRSLELYHIGKLVSLKASRDLPVSVPPCYCLDCSQGHHTFFFLGRGSI